MKSRRKIKPRKTLSKAIAASYKSGDKHAAMELAIYGRKPVGRCLLFSSVTELARELYFLRDAVDNPELQKEMAACPDAVRGKWKEIESEIKIHIAWNDRKWFDVLGQELRRVYNEDVNARLLEKPGITKDKNDNPNWFRQILVANQGLVKTLSFDPQSREFAERKPFLLLQIAKAFKFPVRSLRREVRQMGIKKGKRGAPKKR